MHLRWLPLLAALVALGGCNLVAYDILASGRDSTAAGGALSETDGGTREDGGSGGDPCATFNGGCDARATCVRDGAKAICQCPTGYFANESKQCEDVNECLLADRGGCDANAKCINETGSSRCECKPGFDGDGATCTDIDECATDNGGCTGVATCTNTSGGHTCHCPLGYTVSGNTCLRDPWQKVGDLPAPINSLGATVWKDRLYVVDGNGPTQPADRAWMANILPDGRLGPFTVIEKSPNGRQNHCLTTSNDVMYMIGGSDIVVRDEVLYSAVAANGTLAPWTKTTALPSARTMIGCLAVGGRVYVFGGGYVAGRLMGLAEVIVATPAPDGQIPTWTQLTPLPEPLVVRSAAMIEDRVYVLGENTNNPGAFRPIYSATLLSDGTFDAWTKVTEVPGTYASEPLVTWKRQLHIGAGRLVADVDAAWGVGLWNVFDPEVPAGAQRASHGSVVHNGRAYIIGGNTLGSGSHLTDIRTELLP
jgi:hypothetical protein